MTPKIKHALLYFSDQGIIDELLGRIKDTVYSI